MRTLVKPDLGVKRVCPSCGARFYDLQKRPIECPKCAFTFEPEALLKQRRPRPVDTPVAQPVVAEAEPEEAEEAETEPVVEAEEAEVAVDTAVLAADHGMRAAAHGPCWRSCEAQLTQTA